MMLSEIRNWFGSPLTFLLDRISVSFWLIDENAAMSNITGLPDSNLSPFSRSGLRRRIITEESDHGTKTLAPIDTSVFDVFVLVDPLTNL